LEKANTLKKVKHKEVLSIYSALPHLAPHTH